MEEYHIPVMYQECMDALNIKVGGTYFDGTLGGGGHTNGILSRGGKVVATDRDDDAIKYCIERFVEQPIYRNLTIVKANYKEFTKITDKLNIKSIDGAILDLGISSHQVDEATRGFSFRYDAVLDMRMDQYQEFSALDIVNSWSEKKLSDIIFEYGEEKFAKRIAKNICKARSVNPIETTFELSDIIKRSVDSAAMKNGHPAKKTFQALRIAVNDELNGLDAVLRDITDKLVVGGRLAVITFHSLEDRIVKRTFADLSTGCICDKSLPVCVCGHKAKAKLIGKYKPSKEELEKNPRSASATLRVIEKIEN